MVKFILKLLRSLLRIIIILLITIVVLICFIGLFVNLNNYKTQISSFISKSIGYELKINGSLKWILTHDLIFFAEDVTLNEVRTNKFPKDVLAAKEISIAIHPLYSLFKAKLIISNIKFDSSKFYLFRNGQQETNIDELWQRIIFVTKKIKANLIVDKITFKDADFLIEDQVKLGNIGIKQVNVTLNNELRDVTFDLNSAIIDLNTLNKNNQLKGQINLEGKGGINFNHRTLNITYSKAEYDGIKYTLTGNISYENQKITSNGTLLLQPVHDMSKVKELSLNLKFAVKESQIDLNNILLTLDDGTITGNASFLQANNGTKGDFSLKIHGIEFFKIINIMQDIRHNENFLLLSLLKDLQLNGNIRGNSIYINHYLSIEDLDLPIRSNAPSVFELHQGLFNIAKAIITVNVKADFAQNFKLDVNLAVKDIDLQMLSRALMSGMGKVNMQITSTAENCNAKEILQNLEGKVAIDINNGTLQGIDLFNTLNQYEQNLDYLYSRLQMDVNQDINVLLSNSKKKVQNVIGSQAVSVFSDLHFLAELKKGVANNAEIFLKHPQYLAKGFGTIDLVKNEVNYDVNAKLVKPPNDLYQVTQYMQVVPLLIHATGSIRDINISIDTQNYLLEALKELQKNLLSIKEILSDHRLEESDKSIGKSAK